IRDGHVTGVQTCALPILEQQGSVATFMPKPFSHLTGSGAHFHMSLWDAQSDQNLFLDEADPNGLSTLAYEFIGGLKAHARGLARSEERRVGKEWRCGWSG